MASLLQIAKKYGAQVVQPNATLPGLALDAAHAVALGRASAEDADKVYVAYLDSVMVRSTAQSPSSRKAQVSKLRQIMLLAEEQPAPSARAVGVGREDAPELSRETHVKSLFAAMVDSGARGGARASTQHGRFACADVV